MGGVVPGCGRDNKNPILVESNELNAVLQFEKLAFILAPIEDSIAAISGNEAMSAAFSQFMGKNSLDYSEIECETSFTPVRIYTRNEKSFSEALPSDLSKFLNSSEFQSVRKHEIEEITQHILNMKGLVDPTLPELLCADDGSNNTQDNIKLANATISDADVDSYLVDATVDNSYELSVSTNRKLPHCAEYVSYNLPKKSLQSCDQEQLSFLYHKNSWIVYFMSIAEYLPYSISVSQGTLTKSTFPLISVNSEFVKLSGRNKNEVIGNPGTFLQTRATILLRNQTEKIRNISRALILDDTSLITTLICSKRNGELFHNMIGLKTITDRKEDTKYIISIQKDMTNMTNIAEEKEFILSLLKILPSQV